MSIRAGIAGAGLMGMWHAKAALRSEGRIVAIADLDFKSAEKLSADFPGAIPFMSVKEMLASEKMDVLHICTPLPTHDSFASIAIETGIHSMVEKPFTESAEQAIRLYELANRKGVRLCPIHQFLFQDGMLEAKRLLPSLGKLVHMECVIQTAGAQGTNAEKQDQLVEDILPHPLYLLQALLPEGIEDTQWKVTTPSRGEFRGLSEVEGVSIFVSVSTAARPTVCSLLITGSEGTIYVDLFHGYAFLQPGNVSRIRKILHPFDLSLRRLGAATSNLIKRGAQRESAYPGLRNLIRLFYQSVEKNKPMPIQPEDVLAVYKVRDRLRRASTTTVI